MKFNIESDKLMVGKSSKTLFAFLSDFKNFEHLMPEQVTNWKATEANCSFTIKNMGDISLEIIDRVEDSHIHITSSGNVPFDVDLKAHLQAIDDESSNVHIVLEGEMSQMIFLMAKKPLQNLANHMVQRLREHHS